jgi:prevent-host-death family protein
MATTVNVATARSNMSELLNRVAYGGETVIIEARGKPKAALVNVDWLAAGRTTSKSENSEPLIVTTPSVRSGKPRIAGRRITVSDVAIWHERMAMTPQQISITYDLSLAKVYAALAYYHVHRDEIEAEIEESLRFAAALRRQAPPPLDRKLQDNHAQSPSLPSG